MNFLGWEREALCKFFPDFALDDHHAASPEPLDGANSAIEQFVAAGGAGLLVPHDLGGIGASAMEATRVQRAIGALEPGLAVGMTMHHFSVATLIEMIGTGLESILVEGIARGPLLVASGFAEGQGHSGILRPTMSGVERDGRVRLSGTKRPCSLAWSMDLLAASAEIEGRLAVVLVPAETPGVSVEPYWRNPALDGAESCAVTLTDVEVPTTLVSYAGRSDALDDVQRRAFVWFELLIAASYVGIASGLVVKALSGHRRSAGRIFEAAALCDQAMASLETIARAVDDEVKIADLLGRALTIRYVVQESVMRAAEAAVEALGGTTFASDASITTLLAGCRGLAFHPPRRESAVPRLVDWLAGAPLQLVDI